MAFASLKRRFQSYLGIDESTPQHVSVKDVWASNKGGFAPGVKTYVRSLFPFIDWVPRYNLVWLSGDLIAGITVGLVLVPQSLSYAKLALLSPEYGLYSSFIGVLTYSFFATSKDVSIGPVAVMSIVTGNIVSDVMAEYGTRYTAPEIATGVAFICGFIVLAVGLFRLGWLVEFIPQPAVSGFMTGSAINIAAGQVPALLGTSKLFDTRAATYQVIINTLKYLPQANLDAAFGVSALAMLYGIKWSLAWASTRYPRFARTAFFASTFRHAFVIILFTIISWRINTNLKTARIALVGTVPSGLQHVGQPRIDGDLIAAIGGHIPVATIVLLLEHISIAKSFGRLNGYKINPNQELIAIGFNNTLGTLFSAYPSTGSFSRSALKSKSGVRTPAAGIFTGIVVIVALYAVAPAFYWIPNAALSAIIIHAVADLVASLQQSYGFWRVSPFEYLIFLGAVLWSIFYSIEGGIYWSLATSAALLLVRVARPRGHFLGRVRIQPENPETGVPSRDVYVPLCYHKPGESNITVESPPPGIVIYRFEESFLYPNASYINDRLVIHIKETTRRGKDLSGLSAGDRPWNDPGPKAGTISPEYDQSKPLLRAVILDFSAVANIDTTGVQNLIDTRKEVEKWADRPIEFHFAGILSPWIRRALIAGGFGQGRTKKGTHLEVAPVVANGDVSNPSDQRDEASSSSSTPRSEEDRVEKGTGSSRSSFNGPAAPLHSGGSRTSLPLLDKATPFFHFDLADALSSLDLE